VDFIRTAGAQFESVKERQTRLELTSGQYGSKSSSSKRSAARNSRILALRIDTLQWTAPQNYPLYGHIERATENGDPRDVRHNWGNPSTHILRHEDSSRHARILYDTHLALTGVLGICRCRARAPTGRTIQISPSTTPLFLLWCRFKFSYISVAFVISRPSVTKTLRRPCSNI
jgi:hypothetical protein